jgi:hypothetical protein
MVSVLKRLVTAVSNIGPLSQDAENVSAEIAVGAAVGELSVALVLEVKM